MALAKYKTTDVEKVAKEMMDIILKSRTDDKNAIRNSYNGKKIYKAKLNWPFFYTEVIDETWPIFKVIPHMSSDDIMELSLASSDYKVQYDRCLEILRMCKATDSTYILLNEKDVNYLDL